MVCFHFFSRHPHMIMPCLSSASHHNGPTPGWITVRDIIHIDTDLFFVHVSVTFRFSVQKSQSVHQRLLIRRETLDINSCEADDVTELSPASTSKDKHSRGEYDWHTRENGPTRTFSRNRMRPRHDLALRHLSVQRLSPLQIERRSAARHFLSLQHSIRACFIWTRPHPIWFGYTLVPLVCASSFSYDHDLDV